MTRTLVVALVLVAPLAAQDLFERELLALPGQVQGCQLADFDGDGHADLLAALFGIPTADPWNADALAFVPGDGRGGFGTPLLTLLPGISSTWPIVRLALADMDEDGRPDALVAHDTLPVSQVVLDVRALLADGAGGFAAQAPGDATGTHALDLLSADFDGDGHADALLLDTIRIRVLPGDGTGALGAPVDSPGTASQYGPDADVGDVDGDGVLDLVSTEKNFSSNVQWQRGDGLGGFGAEAQIAMGFGIMEIHRVATADFDQDGALDVASMSDYLDGSLDAGPVLLPFLRVVKGDGHGGFAAAVLHDAPPYVRELRVADLDDSGRPDLVSAHTDNVYVVFDPLGPPPGTVDYKAPGGGGDLVGTLAQTLAVADLDSDGRLDVVSAGSPAKAESFALRLINDGTGLFEEPPQVSVPGAAGVWLAEATGDGATDVLAKVKDGGVVLLVGDGAGGFGAPQPLPASTATYDLAVADFDADGAADIATANKDSHDLSVLIADGQGGWQDREAGGWPWFTWNQSPGVVRAGDLDGDGVPDLVVGKFQKATLTVLRATGDGSFLPPDNIGPPSEAQSDLELGDLDGDGSLDLLGYRVRLNDGAAHFTPGVPLVDVGESTPPAGLALADVNADGRLDAVFARYVYDPPTSSNQPGLATRLGDGQGGLLPSTSSPAPPMTLLALVDLDGDGLLDALGEGPGQTLRASFGEVSGSFAGGRVWRCEPPGVADLDGDGRPDLVAATVGGEAIEVLLHHSTHFTWSDLGHALGGQAAPRLDGHGPLVAGSTLHLHADLLPHDALLTLIFGGSPLGAPFKGGVLLPSPDRILPGLPTGPEGFLALQGTWPAGLPADVELFVQCWVADAAGPQGWIASNALELAAP